MCSFAAINAKEKDRHSLTSVFARISLTMSTLSKQHPTLSSATEQDPGQSHRAIPDALPETIVEENVYTVQTLTYEKSNDQFRVADDADDDPPIFKVPTSSLNKGSAHAVYRVQVLKDADANATVLGVRAAKEPWKKSDEQVCSAAGTKETDMRCTNQA